MRFKLKYYYSLNRSIFSEGSPEYEGETGSEIRGYTSKRQRNEAEYSYGIR
jgi:hypothetical protein